MIYLEIITDKSQIEKKIRDSDIKNKLDSISGEVPSEVNKGMFGYQAKIEGNSNRSNYEIFNSSWINSDAISDLGQENSTEMETSNSTILNSGELVNGNFSKSNFEIK